MEHNIRMVAPQLKVYALSLTRNLQDAEDLLQDTMIRIYKNMDKFRKGTNFKAWAIAIMRNHFINDYRKKSRRRTHTASSFSSYTVETAGEKVTNLGETNIAYDELLAMIDTLPDFFRKPFWMVHEGYKYQEIAEELDAPVGTIKSRIFLARKKLQRLYTAHHILPVMS